MKIRYAILISVGVLLVGYFIGVYMPYTRIPIEVVKEQISKKELWDLLIAAFGALGTFGAVVVALFLNEIRSLFKYVKFNIKLLDNDIIEDLHNVKGSKKAARYYNYIEFYNNGNINAENCELYLESASFTSKESPTKVALSVPSTPIEWLSNNNTVYIPKKGGKKVLQAFSLFAPQKQSTPDGTKEDNPVSIQILGLDTMEADAGEWELNYTLYSTTADSKKVKVVINWNGKWEDRKTEMKDILKINITEL